MLENLLNTPYQIIFKNPLIDIFLITFFVFTFTYIIFYFFFRRETIKLIILDFEIFLILLLFFYLNYKGMKFDVSTISFGYFEKISWWIYFMIIYIIVEFPLYSMFSKKIGFSFDEIDKAFEKKLKKNEKIDKNLIPKRKENLELKIRELEGAKKMLEKDLKNFSEDKNFSENKTKSEIEILQETLKYEIKRLQKEIKNRKEELELFLKEEKRVEDLK